MSLIARIVAEAPGADLEAAHIAQTERSGGVPAEAHYNPAERTYDVTTTSPDTRGNRVMNGLLGR